MADKTPYQEYITQVLESEELFIQQMLQLQHNMNNVAQESLRRRQVYETVLRHIEEREQVELQRLQPSASRSSRQQNNSLADIESTTNATFPDMSEEIASIKQSQSSMQPLTSTPIKRTASTFASPSALNASTIGMNNQHKVSRNRQDFRTNCQLIPCPHCGKQIKICLCPGPQSFPNSGASGRPRSGGSKGEGSRDSSKSTVWEDNFTVKYKESSDPGSTGFLNTVANSETSTILQAPNSGQGLKKNTSHGKRVSFNKDLTDSSFVTPPSTQKYTVNNMEVVILPRPPPVGILSKYENVYLYNFPVPEQNGNSSSSNEKMEPEHSSSQLKAEHVRHQFGGVLNPTPTTESSSKTATPSRSTSEKGSKKAPLRYTPLAAKVSKEKSMIQNGKTKPSSKTIVLKYQLSKPNISEVDGTTSESLSGYDSENSVDSSQTGPFSVQSLSNGDIDDNNNLLNSEGKPNAVEGNTKMKMDKTMIRQAWDRIFGNNDTSAPMQDFANRSVNKIMTKRSDFSVLKTIKNLNLSY